jgi:hypothetical protein
MEPEWFPQPQLASPHNVHTRVYGIGTKSTWRWLLDIGQSREEGRLDDAYRQGRHRHGGNSGIGKAVTLALAQAGANVVIDYVADESATEELEQQVAGLGDRALGVEADVSKVADLQMLIDRTVREMGRLDLMVNNAGVETRTSVLDTSEAQYEKVLRSTSRAPSSAPSWRPSR